MMTTAATVCAGILLLVIYMAAIIGVRAFSRWAIAREAARSFETAFIPETHEVAASEAELGLTDD